MSAKIIQGNVFDVLPTIRPGSVDCCCTSPPYFQLRAYLPKDHPLKRFELGQEKTPAEFIANLVRVFRLVRECLSETGTCWVNIGDTYFGDSPVREKASEAFSDTWDKNQTASRGGPRRSAKGIGTLTAGNLCLIPQRLAIALQDDGWIVRSYVIWQKAAPMPQSVSGWSWRRCRVRDPNFKQAKYGGKGGELDPQAASERIKLNVATARANGVDHENSTLAGIGWLPCPGCPKCSPTGGYVLRKGSWRCTSSYEPVLMLAKSAEYFCDGEPVRTPASGSSGGKAFGRILDKEGTTAAGASTRRCTEEDRERYDGGANLRDVWRIGAEPLKDAHYAAFPTELVRLCLLAGVSQKGYCPTCGLPWVRVIDSKSVPHPSPRGAGVRSAIDTKGGNQANGSAALAPQVKTVGWRPSCKCPEQEPRPGLVLDPFSGSGRTALTAQRLGLDFVGVELNPEYVAMSERILREDSPLFVS